MREEGCLRQSHCCPVLLAAVIVFERTLSWVMISISMANDAVRVVAKVCLELQLQLGRGERGALARTFWNARGRRPVKTLQIRKPGMEQTQPRKKYRLYQLLWQEFASAENVRDYSVLLAGEVQGSRAKYRKIMNDTSTSTRRRRPRPRIEGLPAPAH